MTLHIPIPKERLESLSVANRFFGTEPKHNYFARAKNLTLSGQLDSRLIAQIEQEYGGDLGRDFNPQWCELLEEIVYHMAADGLFDPEEKEFFSAYIRTFRITNEEAARAYHRAAERSFFDMLEREVGPNGLSPSQVDHALLFAKRLRLSEETTRSAFSDVARRAILAQTERALSDGLVTPTEWESIQSLAQNLGVKINLPPELLRNVEIASDRWKILSGPLPTVDAAGIELEKGESAYFTGQATWFEYRKVRSGGESFDELQAIATGSLIVTSKRVLLMPDTGDNRSVIWKSVASLTVHDWKTIELEKTRGKSPILRISTATSCRLELALPVIQRAFGLAK